MDLNLAADPLESFKLFQKMIVDKYDSMINEGNFQVIDATQSIENQQQIVRDAVTSNIPLERFRSKSGRVRHD